MKRLVPLAALALLAVLSRPVEGAPVGRCPLFPAGSFWHADVRDLPVHPKSATYLRSIGRDETVHADFGSGTWDGGPIGIPFNVVPDDQPRRRVDFLYADESDGRRYPIPGDPAIEGGPDADGDRHVLIVERGDCRLHELFDAHPRADGTWRAGSGARWDLRSNALRPRGWTSADAAGLAILPGLVRYKEVRDGAIDHALRFTVPRTRDRYVWPARHQAGIDDPSLPPMGTWLRLKRGFDVSPFPRQVRVILRAMKKHGLILADNGSALFVSGAPHPRWDNDALRRLHEVEVRDFEVVDARPMRVDRDSGRVKRAYRG